MTEARNEEERASEHEHELEPGKPTKSSWDPLSYLRKTLSHTFQMELIRLKRPLLPPEDFMDTADFQRVRVARFRRLMPALIGLAAVTLAALAALGLWLRRPERFDGSAPPRTTPTAQALALPAAAPGVPSAPMGEVPNIASAAANSDDSAHAPMPPLPAPPPRAAQSGTASRPVIRKKPEGLQATPSSSPAPEPPVHADTLWKKPQ